MSYVDLRDLSSRQRKALEDFVTSFEEDDLEVEIGDELESPAGENE